MEFQAANSRHDPESQRSQWAAKITDTEHAKDETLFEVFKALEAEAER